MKLLLKYLMMLTKITNFIAKTKLILGHCKMKEMKKEKKKKEKELEEKSTMPHLLSQPSTESPCPPFIKPIVQQKNK